MKSVIFLSRLFHPHLGGVEKHVDHLTQELIKRDWHVTIIAEQHDPSLGLHETRKQQTIIRIPIDQTQGKLGLWRFVLKNWQLFRQASVVHAHDVLWWTLPIWPLIRHKLYLTCHGYEGSELPSPRIKFAHWLWSKLARGTLCIGDFHKTWYGIKPTFVSYGAVGDTDASASEGVKKQPTKKPISKTSKVKAHNWRRLVFVGRLESDTGIMTYIEGLNLWQKSNNQQQKTSKWSLTVYGEGSLKTKAEAKAKKLGLPVFFKGHVDGVEFLLPKFDVVMASQYLAIMEALAWQKPIIAYTHNRLKEDYLGLAPFAPSLNLVHNPREVAQALEKPKLPSAKVSHWLAKQTWEKLAKQYLKLWSL